MYLVFLRVEETSTDYSVTSRWSLLREITCNQPEHYTTWPIFIHEYYLVIRD